MIRVKGDPIQRKPVAKAKAALKAAEKKASPKRRGKA